MPDGKKNRILAVVTDSNNLKPRSRSILFPQIYVRIFKDESSEWQFKDNNRCTFRWGPRERERERERMEASLVLKREKYVGMHVQ
jgi:hypothetical protein